MSMEFFKCIERENLELDCEALRKKQCNKQLSSDINDLVCDTLDRLIDEGIVNEKETIDVAYYIAEEIKKKFLM